MKKFKTLWVFGSSTSQPNYYVPFSESFWWLTAKYLGADIVKNFSWSASSFDSVCHNLVSHQEEYDWENDFFLIGVPPLERWTVFDQKEPARKYHVFDTNTRELSMVTSPHFENLSDISFTEDKMTVIYSNRSWIETQALRTIFFLHTWLDSVGANYLIVSLTGTFAKHEHLNWSPHRAVFNFCSNHNRNIIFEDTYTSINFNIHRPVDFNQWGWSGHHGPEGNRYYFEQSILPKLKEQL